MGAAQDPLPPWKGTGPLMAGVVALVLLVGGLGLWSVTARLAGAVVASGMVKVESNRQVVQHPDGGVVGAVLVRESDTVEKGDVLIQLDGRRQRSELTIIEGQLREIAARKARLVAERDGAPTPEFPEELLRQAVSDSDVASIVKGERTLFEARREALQQEAQLLEEQNKQVGERIAGLQSQLAALRTQADLVGDDLESQSRLLDNQLTQASRVNELKREEANILGQIGQLDAQMAELRGQQASNEIALLQLKTRRREEAVSTLRDLQFREIELAERKLDLEDTLSRLDIRAPVSGLIYNLQVFAEQSVVRAAEPLLYIVPQDQALVVSSRVQPIHVNDVYVGQEAALRFPAFDQKKVPELRGQVIRVSADAVQDEATGMNYFSAEIMPFERELDKLGNERLLPGMPVEAFIQTGERSPLAYLVQPMMGFLGKAFRE
ncbi:HlyD family type I secretion periplasmic adaptor subunit [Roseovarius aestuariivivens]|uniref:HlyD family type I secretion periplasmic adaptor subunit n=1 Tax=Roseovarius aestuariivivens TaxID=1888910 RepID=UPI001081C992|nr:HlyD family type I secretion periplasmic adaptor subunit [Roseovarius aestuariivivens]